jgi:hypothetical protein
MFRDAVERTSGRDDLSDQDLSDQDLRGSERRRIPNALAFLYGLTAAVMVFAVLVFVWMYWLAGALGV